MRCINPKFQPKAGFEVPCGKCYSCAANRVQDWCTRIHFESLHSYYPPLFITLTYATKNLKTTARNGRYASLCKRDLQNFFKRLRKRERKQGNTRNIRYLACGEYGTRNKRPHYHVLVFNVQRENIIPAWSILDSPIGQVYFGDCSGKSAAYTVGYTLSVEANRTHVIRYHLQKEFKLFSKGIGDQYTTSTAAISHNRRGAEGHFVTIDGQRKRMPRYYTDRIYTPSNKIKLKEDLSEKFSQKPKIILSLKQLKDEHYESSRKLTQKRKESSPAL